MGLMVKIAIKWICYREQVNYFPSMIEKQSEHEEPEGGMNLRKEPIQGVRVKEGLPPKNEYKQAGDRIRAMTPDQ